ncbi:uncharacterized protein Dana_GF13271 [Drosophila ananassae]|uniref:Uncharacterized protein n=1 Tax=Drosophila ananassae TaxID=7217 RepID=B3MJ06_DROAN|nr:uncharacterized protein LOC6496113 [Drosophila ananassae]EDV37072.1 uncharacterized protein Dana_GF13271 [Drosophila ananassae]KAH8316519.1 hypothetical protein KR067_009573 [Drosophila pandora]
MPVAVRLVEALTLITIMGLITCIGLSVILTQHTISLAVTFLEPAANIVDMALLVTEKILVSALLVVLRLTNTVGNALQAAGMA